MDEGYPGLGSIDGPRACPAGATGLSPGFNPGNPQNKRFALKLKGREMRVPDETRTYSRAKVRVRNRDVLQLNHRTPLALFRTFDLAPLQHLQPGGPVFSNKALRGNAL